MMLKQTLLATAIVLAPMAALAGGSVDVFYTDNNVDIEAFAAEADGNGYGIRGQAELGKGFSMIALHQTSKVKPLFGGGKSDVSETRIGLSYKHQLNKQTHLTGTLEKVQADVEFVNNGGTGLTLNGYAGNVGINVAVAKKLNAYASVGYVNLGKINNETLDGYEYTGGLSYDICKHWSGFAEYRVVKMETDAVGPSTDVDNDTLRVGGRYTF
ncbi:MAG: hypothetical protein AABY68_05835 [Pseudomonadota bacterium]